MNAQSRAENIEGGSSPSLMRSHKFDTGCDLSRTACDVATECTILRVTLRKPRRHDRVAKAAAGWATQDVSERHATAGINPS